MTSKAGKLDMSRAWSDAMALLSANSGVIATVIGLFYFLPQFALALFVPETLGTGINPDISGESAEALIATFQEFYADIWPYLLVTELLTYVGTLSVLALLRHRGNPTVGEALGRGMKGTPSYLATQIIFGIGAALALGVPLGLLGALAPVAAAIAVLPLLALLVYALFKLLLVPAVIAIEGTLNPLTAIARSWRLTKGNTLRLFVFIVLLYVVIVIITVIVTLVTGLVFSALGEAVARIGTAFVGALAEAVLGAIYCVVIASVYRQVAGGGESAAETFE